MKYLASVQIVLTFDLPVEAETFDEAAESVENMGREILDHAPYRPGDVWVTSVETREP